MLPSRDLHHDQKQYEEEDEKTRRIREKEEQLRKQEVHGQYCGISIEFIVFFTLKNKTFPTSYKTIFILDIRENGETMKIHPHSPFRN